jgi:HD superfamily phosphohydrolase
MINIQDSVHGSIFVPEYIEGIICTEQFRRLKNIKQLGVSNYIFPGAIHSRFEHSIGTAYLCQLILSKIELNSAIQVDEKHKKCVIVSKFIECINHNALKACLNMI